MRVLSKEYFTMINENMGWRKYDDKSKLSIVEEHIYSPEYVKDNKVLNGVNIVEDAIESWICVTDTIVDEAMAVRNKAKYEFVKIV
jgi:hypothetical protein